MNESKINKFNFEKLTNDRCRNIAIIGPTQSGKTTVIKTILSHLSSVMRYAVVFSTDKYTGSNVYAYEKYSEDRVKAVCDDQIKIRNDKTDHEKRGISSMVAIVLDDIINNESKLGKNDDIIERIITNGAYYNISLIISVQNPLFVPPKMRENLGYVIATSINTEKRIKTFYEYYIKDYKFEEFVIIYKTIMQEKYNLMIIDNTIWTANIFYGKATLPKLSECLTYCMSKKDQIEQLIDKFKKDLLELL